MNKAMLGAMVAIGLAAAAAEAKWTEVAAGQPVPVAKSRLAVTAPPAWNRTSARPSKKSETWSFDGPLLNRIDFFAAVAPGEALLRERDRKRNPLPTFAAAMLPNDVAELFERTQRIAAGTADFAIDTVAPATFAGARGFRFTYHYTGADETLTRKGLASGAVIGGKLYLISYAAPAVHYYDAGLAGAQAIMESARLL